MKAEPFVVSPKTYEPALNVLGVRVTVLASNLQTQGYEITLQSGDEGVGPPPHRHDWDETFFVLRGSVELSIEGSGGTGIASWSAGLARFTSDGIYELPIAVRRARSRRRSTNY